MLYDDSDITLLRGPDDVATWKRDVALLFFEFMKPQSSLGHPVFNHYPEQYIWNLMYRSVQPVAERLRQDGWDPTYTYPLRLWQAVTGNDWLAPSANVRLDTTSPGTAGLIKALYALTAADGSVLDTRHLVLLLHKMDGIKSKLADLGLLLRDDFMMGRLLPKLQPYMAAKTLTNMQVLASNNLLPWGPTVRWMVANLTKYNKPVIGLKEFFRDDIRYDTPAPGSNAASSTGPDPESVSVFGFDPGFGPSSGPRFGPGFGPGFGLSSSWP